MSDRSVAEVVALADARFDGVTIGRVVRLDEDGTVRVSFPGSPGEFVPATCAVSLSAEEIRHAVATGQGAVLMFEQCDPTRPVLMGLVRGPVRGRLPEGESPEVFVDGERVEVEAQRELVLRCGKASITLRANGRVVIRGVYVETRAAGTNRIKGGNVQIN